jgi:hypothetical protein
LTSLPSKEMAGMCPGTQKSTEASSWLNYIPVLYLYICNIYTLIHFITKPFSFNFLCPHLTDTLMTKKGQEVRVMEYSLVFHHGPSKGVKFGQKATFSLQVQ